MSEADIVAFGGISGDFFYMHFDEIAAKESAFGKRIAHGYFVLSAAAGLFVSPAPGPVLANYGLDTLRFVKPVAIGDTIRARLTCKRKIDRNRKDAQGKGQGVVAWDVEVTNQADELVASYDILTLVAKRAGWTARATLNRRHDRRIEETDHARIARLAAACCNRPACSSPAAHRRGWRCSPAAPRTPAPMAETTMQEMTASDALSRIRSGTAVGRGATSARCSTGPSASRT